ncbi:MAG: hypothetical protein R3F43_29705 [bacterium]
MAVRPAAVPPHPRPPPAPDRLPRAPRPHRVVEHADPIAQLDALDRLPDPPGEARGTPWPIYRRTKPLPAHLATLTASSSTASEFSRRYETPPAQGGRSQWILTADRYWIVGDEPWRWSSGRFWKRGRPVALTVERATAGSGRRRAVAALPGQARRPPGDVVWPEGLGGGTTRAVVVRVAVATVEGPAEARLQAVHTRRDAVPARFTGALADAEEAGSLRVDVGIDVARAGRYLIDANLYDDAGEPVAWARYKGELAEGLGTVPLRFFGKVLVDAGRPGPWRLGELRGVRHAPGAFPDLEPMAPFLDPWRTRPWRLDAFSDAEWAGPARAARLAALARSPFAPPRPGDGLADQRFGAVGGRRQGME